MRTKRIILPAMLFLSYPGLSAVAQDAPPRLEFFAEGGGSFLNNGTGQAPISCIPEIECPTTPTSSFSKTGRLFTGARLRFTRHDAVEASYSFSPNHFSLQYRGESLGSAYNRVNLISFNYVRYLWARSPVQPFATIGLGTNRFSGPSSTSTVASHLVSPDNGYQFAWNYGGGADVVLQRHFVLRLEIRDYVTGQPGFITGTSHNVVPSAGVVFRFK
ncbi:MAG: outer membrane beta-barrel protein [Terriglobia bacterium]